MQNTQASEERKVGIDARSLRSGPAGVATYVRNLVRHISFLEPIFESFPGNNLLWNHSRVPYAQFRSRWLVYHAPAYTAPLLSFLPVVLSVHDMSHLTHPEWYPYRFDRIRKRYYQASLRKADRLIVPSRFSAQEICRFDPRLGERIRCIPLAVSESFRYDGDLGDNVRDRLGLPQRFLLHVGDIHRRRNIPMLVRVAERCGIPLVLVGRLLEPSAVIGDPRIFSGVSAETLRGIYSAATLFVYPSLYEGFGLPLLEAMASGLPVVASRRASIPEVCGDAAILVEPEEAAFLRGVEQALDESDAWRGRGLKRSALFRWEDTARSTALVYEELMRESGTVTGQSPAGSSLDRRH